MLVNLGACLYRASRDQARILVTPASGRPARLVVAWTRGCHVSTSILYLAIVAIWAVFLVPAWLRRPHAPRAEADDAGNGDGASLGAPDDGEQDALPEPGTEPDGDDVPDGDEAPYAGLAGPRGGDHDADLAGRRGGPLGLGPSPWPDDGKAAWDGPARADGPPPRRVPGRPAGIAPVPGPPARQPAEQGADAACPPPDAGHPHPSHCVHRRRRLPRPRAVVDLRTAGRDARPLRDAAPRGRQGRGGTGPQAGGVGGAPAPRRSPNRRPPRGWGPAGLGHHSPARPRAR